MRKKKKNISDATYDFHILYFPYFPFEIENIQKKKNIVKNEHLFQFRGKSRFPYFVFIVFLYLPYATQKKRKQRESKKMKKKTTTMTLI